jgi:hypothetical protein
MTVVAGVKGFQEGESGNPQGRPKGSVNETTKRYARLKTLASEKYEEAFSMLWQAMEAGQGWAHKIYFTDLVPKRVHQPTITVDLTDSTPDGQIISITRGLSQFDELTHDEALSQVKTLSNIKLNESLTKEQTNVFEKLSDTKLRQLHLWLEEEKKDS